MYSGTVSSVFKHFRHRRCRIHSLYFNILLFMGDYSTLEGAAYLKYCTVDRRCYNDNNIGAGTWFCLVAKHGS
jgi:hypothetical protein